MTASKVSISTQVFIYNTQTASCISNTAIKIIEICYRAVKFDIFVQQYSLSVQNIVRIKAIFVLVEHFKLWFSLSHGKWCRVLWFHSDKNHFWRLYSNAISFITETSRQRLVNRLFDQFTNLFRRQYVRHDSLTGKTGEKEIEALGGSCFRETH